MTAGEPKSDDIKAVEQREPGHAHANPDRQAKRSVGKTDDTVYGKPKHFAQRIFALAVDARRPAERDLGGAEAEPGKHAAHEPVVLRHGAKGIERLTV